MNRFELARYEAGLTIAQAAERSSLSIRTVRRAEDETTERPTAPTVKALARTYGKRVAWLLGQSDDATTEQKAAA